MTTVATRITTFRNRHLYAAYDPARPWVLTLKGPGKTLTLPVLGGVHPAGRWDGLSRPRLLPARGGDAGSVWIFTARSTLWKTFRTVWTFTADTCRVHHEVTGRGDVDCIVFFETARAERLPETGSTLSLVRSARPPLRRYAEPAPYAHARLYNPQPYSGLDPVQLADQPARITAACTFGPVDFNTWFSPGLFCFGLLDKSSAGLFAGLNAAPGGHLYHTFNYNGGGGGWSLSADFDGKVHVRDRWRSPEVELAWAGDVESGLRAHVASGRARGWFPEPAPTLPPEWARPIFCGWGQQEAWSRDIKNGLIPFNDLQVSPSAGELSSEAAYREMIRLLNQSGVPFGTLTIDMGWSLTQAIPQADPAKWPDLKAFIAEQHAQGRKVLLWLSCWTLHGLPEGLYQMQSKPGLRPLLDPSLPAFRKALSVAIHEAISPEGLNADGFKIDFSGDIPRGDGYTAHGSLWGVELLRDYIGYIYRRTKAAKKNAVLQTHCANPLFADRTDILRLNDIFDDRVDVRPMMRHRAQMARIASDRWLIDTDGDPFIKTSAWWDYLQLQPELGVPSLMTLTGMTRSLEEIPPARLRALAKLWGKALPTAP